MHENGTSTTLHSIRASIFELGYAPGLVLDNYRFADVFSRSTDLRQIPIAAFAQDPPDYQSACLGVFFSDNGGNVASLQRLVSLGAPLLFGVRQTDKNEYVDRWRVDVRKGPTLLESIPSKYLANAFIEH